MAAEPGGIGSKLGGTYERRFATEQLLRMVAGRLLRILDERERPFRRIVSTDSGDREQPFRAS